MKSVWGYNFLTSLHEASLSTQKKEIKVDIQTHGLVIEVEGYWEESIKLKNQALVGRWVF